MEIQGEDINDWLMELLEEVGLQQFYSKLTKDLQLTKLSHFDYASEEDLVQLGMSKPAAKRLLAAIRKRKSFITALKNKIVNKLIPTSTSSSSNSSNSNHRDRGITESQSILFTSSSDKNNSEFGKLTCLINSQDVQIKEEIGHGVHGFVKKGEWLAPNGRVVEVALKILRKDVMSEPGATFNDFVKEISVMHQLNHPNIIKLYGVVLSSPMMMVTELAPLGNLRDHLRKEGGCTLISQLINFGVQISSGMEYLESKRFVHRDLATRNIFLSHGKKILIGDLGLMRVIPTQEDHYVMSEKTKIPYPWCAPESLKFKRFSSASDVYMFGVTLWEMFSFGKEPWAGLGLKEILDNISTQHKRLPCPESCPSMVYQTFLQCWNTESTSRPNFTALYQYLSTSYPLEVRSTQHISELGQKRQNGLLIPNDLNNSSSPNLDVSESIDSFRKVLTCNVDDRILVIDGQSEKYWWKGQNQRTFEIGWFPLCATQWLVSKRGLGYISKPLKNSFVHTGHCGPDGKWGSPKYIDQMYLKNPLAPDDINALNTRTNEKTRNSLLPKSKAKSRLSRLFGMNDASPHIIPHPHQKFKYDEFKNSPTKKTSQLSLVRSQSDEVGPNKELDDDLPLIDLSEDVTISNGHTIMISQPATLQESLLDLDNEVPVASELIQRPSSETRLDRMDEAENYRLSWAGSWNTGTFDGSNSNIYSAYYCPQDAALPNSSEANRYYSAVTQEDRVNIGD